VTLGRCAALELLLGVMGVLLLSVILTLSEAAKRPALAQRPAAVLCVINNTETPLLQSGLAGV
jgi:hypothetical protein